MGEIAEAQNSPGFWNDQEKSQRLVAELKSARAVVEPIRKLEEALEEVSVLQVIFYFPLHGRIQPRHTRLGTDEVM